MHQPKLESLWLNGVFAGLCLLTVYDGFSLASPRLVQLLALCVLFATASLLDGEPRWSGTVMLRSGADAGVRMGAMTLPLLLFAGASGHFWPALYWSLAGVASLRDSRAPLRGGHWAALLPLGSALVASVATTDRASPIAAFASGAAYWFCMRHGLAQLPRSFSWGEAHLLAQLAALGAGEWLRLSWTRDATMIQALCVALTMGMLAIGAASWRLLQRHAAAPSLGAALGFYGLSAALVLGGVQPWIYLVTGEANPWLWTVRFIVGSPAHCLLFAYWSALLLAVLFVFDLPTWSARYPLIVVRKFYHLLALAMFLPGLLFARDFLALSYAVALSGLLAVEWLRVGNVPPFGAAFRSYIGAFVDARDSGPLVTTHLYLLVGCALPLWLTLHVPAAGLAPYVGLLSLGVGDTLASLVGLKLGRRRWPASRKTVEGTVAGALGVFAVGVVCLGLQTGGVSLHQLLLLAVSSALVMLLEAVTNQIDNLFLPIWFLIFLTYKQ